MSQRFGGTCRFYLQDDNWFNGMALSGESERNVTVQIHSSLPLKPIHFLPPLYFSIHLNQLSISRSTHAFYRNVAIFVYYASCKRPSFEGKPRRKNLKYCIRNQDVYSWFQTFAVFWMLYVFFWAVPRPLNFICRRFGTLGSIFIGG